MIKSALLQNLHPLCREDSLFFPHEWTFCQPADAQMQVSQEAGGLNVCILNYF